MGEGLLRGGEGMEIWTMAVQYLCAAAGAAAVVHWVDGCGRKKKNASEGKSEAFRDRYEALTS